MTWDEVLREVEAEHGTAEEMHILPEGDLKEHEETDCWCNPSVEYAGDVPIYVHNSLDGREGRLN